MAPKTNLLEYVIGRLSANVGRWPEIAEASGVPYSTLAKIAQRVTENPRIESVQRLADYFASEKAA